MNWIRIATGMKNDPDITRIAESCKVRVAEIVGCVTSLLSELPDHAREGNLTNVPDTLLEQWAGWEGKRGLFAQAFVAHLCIDRSVRSWEKYNGAAVRKSDRARDRARAWRENKKEPEPDTDTDAVRETNANRTRTVRHENRKEADTDDDTERIPYADRTRTKGVPNAERTHTKSIPYAFRTVLRDGTGLTTTTANAVAVVSDHDRVQKIRDQFTEPEHVAAFDRHLRSHRAPDAFLFELEALTRERPSDGASGLAWPVIGQALHELSVAGTRADSARIRSFAGTIQRRERGDFDQPLKKFSENSSSPPPTWDELISREEASAHVE